MRDLPNPAGADSRTSWPSPFVLLPAPLSQGDLLLATDQGRQAALQAAGEASASAGFTGDPPEPHRAANSLELMQPEILVIEGPGGEAMREFAHQHGIRGRRRLDPRRQVQCLADGDVFLGAALADQFAHDHQAGGDADPDLRAHGGASLESVASTSARPARTARSASSSWATG